MSKIGGKNILSVEFKIFIVILAIAVLNNILLANLSDKSENIYTFFTSVPLSFSVYLLYIIASCFGIIFKMGKFLRWIFMGLLAFMTYHIFVNLVELILNKQISQNGEAILLDALIIWLSSLLVFSLWYWIVDRNGPVARELAENETRYDLLFPQYQSKIPGWDNFKPKFLDYVFFSFFTSTGFSPADTLPLTKRVKLLMMMEATISLIIIGMVASRAISLIQ
ncbi:MAG: hypothetical protein KBC00_01910 [Candidatus Levybacteria bacterium]|nr:hypothetical protein [Candidatus Levybacteria bacterium]MBP9815079.1 hypothetical protein [Candidatus Levybacteria bacterium]